MVNKVLIFPMGDNRVPSRGSRHAYGRNQLHAGSENPACSGVYDGFLALNAGIGAFAAERQDREGRGRALS
jgi:hypothetical protein